MHKNIDDTIEPETHRYNNPVLNGDTAPDETFIEPTPVETTNEEPWPRKLYGKRDWHGRPSGSKYQRAGGPVYLHEDEVTRLETNARFDGRWAALTANGHWQDSFEATLLDYQRVSGQKNIIENKLQETKALLWFASGTAGLFMLTTMLALSL